LKQANKLSEPIARSGASYGLAIAFKGAGAGGQIMYYEPADHTIEPRQTAAAWVIYAALLVTALGASINPANSHSGSLYATLLAQRGAVTTSTWIHDEHGHIGTGCADHSDS
jgi:hypothetical protein